MTQPFKPLGGITTNTYSITNQPIDSSTITTSIYEGASLVLPCRERTTMVYEDDGHGSAVLRDIIGPHGQFAESLLLNANTSSRRSTTTYDEDGRMIGRSDGREPL